MRLVDGRAVRCVGAWSTNVASLFVVRGNDQGFRYELTEEVTAVGRDVGNSVQLHDTEVSRRHALIRREGNDFLLSDHQSSNGTYVNGRRVQKHKLTSGDEVQLGGTMLLFTGGTDEASNLAEKIDIVSRGRSEDRSRVVRSLPQAAGREMFDAEASASAAAPGLAKARSNLEVMYRTTLAVSHTLDIDQLLHAVMQLIFEWVECDRGCVMLLDVETGKLEPRVRRNRRSSLDDQRITISKTILDQVMERNEGVLISDAAADVKWNSAASIVQAGIREAICAPMQGRHSLVGVIYLDVSTPPHQVLQTGGAAKFNDEHLRLLIAIAHQAALAVEDTRYYSAMVQAERLAAVGQAIACLSHHVKNILQGIRGGSYLIKEGIAKHDEHMVSKGWEFVEKNQDRISHLVMDMLTFSKEREPEMAPADLTKVVGDVVELMESRGTERGVEVRFERPAFLPKLTFDAEGLHRAVLNVVSNAIDACDREARRRAADDVEEDENENAPEVEVDPAATAGHVLVTIEYDPARSLVQVRVADDGGGISAADQEHIFSLFVSNKGARGTGLGLPVSQKIMREHGGRIAVESEPGRGATFILEMPAVLADVTRNVDLTTDTLG
jgi:two-component system NtrC family sensor kinase